MKLLDQMIDIDGEGYYRLDIILNQDGMTGRVHVPGVKKVVTVEKRFYKFPTPHESFAWHPVNTMEVK